MDEIDRNLDRIRAALMSTLRRDTGSRAGIMVAPDTAPGTVSVTSSSHVSVDEKTEDYAGEPQPTLVNISGERSPQPRVPVDVGGVGSATAYLGQEKQEGTGSRPWLLETNAVQETEVEAESEGEVEVEIEKEDEEAKIQVIERSLWARFKGFIGLR